MGKSWKGDNAWKYKKDKNFQKKQKQKHPHMPLKSVDPYPNDRYMTSATDDILGDSGHHPLQDMM